MGLGNTAANIVFKFIGDSKSLQRASQRGGRSLGQLDKKVDGSTRRLGLMQKAAGALGLTMLAGKLYQGIGAAIARAEEMDSKYAITKQIIKDTGGAAGLTGDQVREMSAEMSKTTGLNKAVVTDAANVLLTFKEIKDVAGANNDIFSRSLVLTADMAAVFGGEAKDAAKQLGKALNDPIGGITALSRVGVQFTEDQKSVIKSLVETGDILGAQKVILQELESQVGGTAAASADASAIMKRGFDEVTEAVGMELLPVLQDLVVVLGDVDGASSPAIEALGEFISTARDAGKAASTAADDSLPLVERFDGIREAASDMVKYGTGKIPIFGGTIAGAFERIETAVGLAGDKFDVVQVSMGDVATIAGGQYESSMRDAASATDEATDAVVRLASEQRAMVDPVFRLKRAEDKLVETLRDVKEDGILTADELDKLTQAHLDVQVASEAVTPENMQAYQDAVTDVRENVVNDADLMEKAIGTVGSVNNLAAIQGFLGRLEELTGKTITIDLSGIRLASQSEIEQAVNRALWAAQRRGATGNVFL